MCTDGDVLDVSLDAWVQARLAASPPRLKEKRDTIVAILEPGISS